MSAYGSVSAYDPERPSEALSANADDWMRGPPISLEETSAVALQTLDRPLVEVELRGGRFFMESKHLGHQYYHMYLYRAKALRPVIKQRILDLKSDFSLIQERILNLTSHTDVYVIGTIVKNMAHRPSVLDEYKATNMILQVSIKQNFISNDDQLFLEDETGRVKLSGCTLSSSDFLTGLVVGVFGKIAADGSFEVKRIVVPGMPLQPPVSGLTSCRSFVAFLSDLGFGDPNSNPLRNQVLADYLNGHLGSAQELKFLSKIVRAILVGNVTYREEEKADVQVASKSCLKKTAQTEKLHLQTTLAELDEWLFALSSTLDVDVMPGPNDPSNYSFPQRPLHPCFFPTATKNPTLHLVTNPHEVTIDGLSLLGHSGQPFEDALRCMLFRDAEAAEAEFLQKTLEWRHMAPTAPDTLSSFPFASGDPFVIDRCPHVYFMGCCNKFQTKLLRGAEGQRVRLLAVPSFRVTKTIVLMDLGTLECYPIRLDIS
ncbi:uncharacterized protein LOC126318425 [Schistocerca gregaria]|uniref:uncharacterized protein LOC126318425 n=1 Tax=Schistocerca gregaria TaxID=7010 RepID=UPI00211E7E37|nr:uncharacterized protein LOC126318425 [Schistocerca gregaria]